MTVIVSRRNSLVACKSSTAQQIFTFSTTQLPSLKSVQVQSKGSVQYCYATVQVLK
jgi:hypothetical protein